MINTEEFRDLIREVVREEIGDKSIYKIGEVASVGDKVSVIFSGEAEPSQKQYTYLKSYSPGLGDRVILMKDKGTYVILGKIGERGKGITFGEHLADSVSQVGGVHGMEYEEGTFTPSLNNTPRDMSNTYSVQEGRYIKINSMVYIKIEIRLSYLDIQSNTQGQIYGLPFNNNGIEGIFTVSLMDVKLEEIDKNIAARIRNGYNRIDLLKNRQSDGAPTQYDLVNLKDTSIIYVSGSYQI